VLSPSEIDSLSIGPAPPAEDSPVTVYRSRVADVS